MVDNEHDQKMIFDNIDEYVKDNNKVVSYRWLSLNLSINANKAKSYLEQYYSQYADDLEVIYFIAGTKMDSQNNKTHCYQLARKASVNDVKSQYVDVTSCHIYSLQKCKMKDASILYSSDMDIIKECLHKLNDFSSIRCEQAKSRTKTHTINGVNKNLNGSTSHTVFKQPVQKVEQKVHEKPKEVQKESPPLSFFGKTSTGQKIKTDNKVSKNDADTTNNKTKIKKTTSFFNSKPKTERKLEKVNEKKEDIEKIKKTDTKKDELKKIENECGINKKNENKEKEENTTMGKLHEKTKESINSEPIEDESIPVDQRCHSKKRKALVEESNSDDDDFESFVSNNKKMTPDKTEEISNILHESMDDEEIVAPTPEPVKQKTKRRRKEVDENKNSKLKEKLKGDPPVVISSNESLSRVSEPLSRDTNHEPVVTGKKRKRRTVLKSKQFLDEEGFMVTRKEYESESCSDEESDKEMSKEQLDKLPPVKKQAAILKQTVNELEKKSTSHNRKTKHQASLTNFFKKK